MKIFINSNREDRKYVELIVDNLVPKGHEIFYEPLNIKPGDNWFAKLTDKISEFNAIIIILSRDTINSKRALHEIESIIFGDIYKPTTRIIIVTTDGSVPPSYLMNYQVIDFSKDLNFGLEKLTSFLSDNKTKRKKTEKSIKKDHSLRNESFLNSLSQALKSGELSLICGAGVSIGAKIPSWNELLLDLLETMMKRVSNDQSLSFKGTSIEEYQKKLGASSLIMGKYLKSNLGNDFLTELRNSLYKNDPKTCEIIDAIVEVSRPQRDGKPLNSIITFNFDGLIEENLGFNKVKYKAIDNEGIRNSPDELPIYHVHGYLPRKGKIQTTTDVVFSEDSYHTQFIEPYSWSNLIQLNKLSQNTCLFLGLSLTDPNLRRLLDVANRKDPTNNLNHYIIKKIPNLDNSDDQKDDLMIFLEEQDANGLGLNVIWVKDFNEIGPLIRKLIK